MKVLENIRVKFSGRGHMYTEEEIAVVVKAMRESDPLTQSANLALFESRFKEFNNVKNAFAVANCSAALQLSAMLTKLGPGDEVILPAHTFAASAIPYGRSGAKIVWADIDPETWVMDVNDVKKKITSKTKVIVPVHLYGLCVDMDPLLELAREKNIFIIEDCAQAPGAKYKGHRAGSMGDFACFSFHSHKNMTTLGEGGMLVVKDDKLAAVVPGLRHNGMRPFTGEREAYWKPAMSNVDFDWDGVWPYKFTIGEAPCALGAKLLERLDAMNAERRARFDKVTKALKDFPELSFQKIPAEQEAVFHLLPAKYDGTRFGKTRDDFIEKIAFTHGIQAIVQYYPLYRYPLFQKAGFGNADCPNTDHFFDNMISLPFQHWLSESDLDVMIDAVRTTCEELRKGA